MNERLLQFLAAENISQSQFAETIGVARASVSHIIAGRNKPGYEFICSILERYPSLNPEWILLGKGKMYKGAIDKGMSVAETPSVAAQTAMPEPETEPTLLDLQEDAPAPMVVNGTAPAAAASPAHIEAAVPAPAAGTSSEAGRCITKIIVFYSDNTFQELKG